jgi:hypothetical protein
MKSAFRLAMTALAAVIITTAGGWAQGADGSYQTIELLGGSAYNFDSDLEITQRDEPPLNIDAEWDVGGSGAPYYIMRYGNWDGDDAWEIEHIHHKIELSNNPPEVADYQISHGFNMFMYNRAWKNGRLIQRAGIGIVVGHNANTVRGMRLDEDAGGIWNGYDFAGGAAQYGASYQWPIAEQWFVTVDGKATVAYAEADVVNGESNLWNYAIHYAAGFGYRWE